MSLINLVEVAKENWSFGIGVAQYAEALAGGVVVVMAGLEPGHPEVALRPLREKRTSSIGLADRKSN